MNKIKISKNNNINQFLKYALVGGINLILSIGLLLLLLKVFLIEYMITGTITWLFGIFLTYSINFLWVFKPEEKLEFKKRFPKYFVVYVISFVINMIILKFLVEKYSMDPFIAQFGILPLVVVINFFGFKYWALK